MTLRELSVERLAVIDSARLDLGSGFTVLSGETGAGKSMCIAALRAVLGGRIDPDLVRTGAAAARVRAVFDNIPEPAKRRLSELGVPQDELLVAVREVPAQGRSVCRINGALVSQPVLREVGDQLVDVTAQGASHRLLQPARQRDLVDLAGGAALAETKLEAQHRIAAWREAAAEADAARAAARSSAAAVSEARDLVARLEPLHLRPDEEGELGAECLRLRHAVRIVAALEGLALAAGSEGAAADHLAASLPALSAAAEVDPALLPLAETAAALIEGIRELARDARSAAELGGADPQRLAEVEARLEAIADVRRRHGSVAGALSELERARRLLQASEDGDHGARLEAAAAEAQRAAALAAAELSRRRASAARQLERAVEAELRRLDLGAARFRVILNHVGDPSGLDVGDGVPVRCHASGVDEVEFRLATHRDMVAVPLGEGPSGGELSRLALAISASLHDEDPVTLVLDEVDTGIGGETAARVGEVLATIGMNRQVVAVTHRAEIAARAARHLRVGRVETDGGAAATVEALAGSDRVEEVARLLSGTPTPAARRRARELLAAGGPASPAARRRRSASTM